MVSTAANAIRFLWEATRGYRLCPWRSPYLRWRFETYTGKPAGSLTARDFLALVVAEWPQMLRFFRWTGEIGVLAAGGRNA